MFGNMHIKTSKLFGHTSNISNTYIYEKVS